MELEYFDRFDDKLSRESEENACELPQASDTFHQISVIKKVSNPDNEIKQKEHTNCSHKILPNQEINKPEYTSSFGTYHQEVEKQVSEIQIVHTSSSQEQIPNNSAEFSKCQVCGDTAKRRSYKILSCSSCKSFFRRTIISQLRYKCLDNPERCELGLNKRRKCCKACRFKKCLEAGMDPNTIRKVPNNYEQLADEILRAYKESVKPFITGINFYTILQDLDPIKQLKLWMPCFELILRTFIKNVFITMNLDDNLQSYLVKATTLEVMLLHICLTYNKYEF